MNRILLPTALACLAAAATAQVGPTLLTPHAGSTTFDAATNPVLSAVATNIHTAAFFKLANNAAGEWTVGMTLSNGADTDCRLAMWSPNPGGTPSLVLTNEAAACNSADNEYLLQIEPGKGRYAVFDRFAAVSWAFLGVYLSSRTGPGTAFGAPAAIQGVQGTNGWGDPSLGYVGGQLMLFYGGSALNPNGVLQDAILMASIDLTNPAAPQAGKPTVVAWPVSGRVPHSPTPVVGPDGDVEGLFLGEVDFGTGDSDMYFADDLDPQTPHMIVFDTPGWLNGGGVAGGYLAAGDFATNYVRLREAPAAWLIGDAEPMVQGGIQVDVRTGSPHAGGGIANVTFLFLSPALLGTPVPAPSIILGSIGLSAPIGTLAVLVPSVPADEEASWSMQLPYLPPLVGVTVHLQALAVQPSTGAALMTNTARIRF